MLGARTRETNQRFADTWQYIDKLISLEEVGAAVAKTLDELEPIVKGRAAAMSWSGGKCSLALELICRMAGIEAGVCSRIPALEFAEFEGWLDAARPCGVELIENRRLGFPWLARNRFYLFPNSSDKTHYWIRQLHQAEDTYCKRASVDLLICGHTKLNNGRQVPKSGIRRYSGSGVERYYPLRYWAYEEILGLLHYRRILLPPTYEWINGWVLGTGCWPSLPGASWQDIYQIDRRVVIEAAQYLKSANKFLELKESARSSVAPKYA